MSLLQQIFAALQKMSRSWVDQGLGL